MGRVGLATAAAIAVASLVTAAGAAGAKGDGGTLRVNVSNLSIASLDPALDYEQYGGEVLYATCLRLLNYSDRAGSAGRLVPEAAAAFPTVSEDGRTYTYTVRSGFRFDDGSPVTADNFARAVERVLNKRMASPGAQFYTDLVGADAVLAGKATRPRGVHVSGNTISFTLTRPSPTFPARTAMAFMCAQPVDLPIAPRGVEKPPMAGPYEIASVDPGRTIVLQRNPYYAGSRPAHADRIVVKLSTNLDQSLLQVRAGQADYDMTGLPPSAVASLAKTYGINRGRFFLHPGLVLDYLALNSSHGPLRDVSLRKAVNYAIDRGELARISGYLGGAPDDQVLVPGIPGYRQVRIYPNHADDPRALALIHGRKVTLRLYGSQGQPIDDQDEAIRSELARVGIDVKVISLPFDQLIQALGNPRAPYDMVNIGWGPDFVDPYDYLDILLNGERITARNNVEWAQFTDRTFERRLDRAALLTGPPRFAAYAGIDRDVMREGAPLAPMYHSNVRELVSKRVGCYTFVPAMQAMSLAAACIR